jgi:DNA repair photolyase
VRKVKTENRKKTGTREWAEHNRNIQLGCENDCRYCYAREMAVRFKRCTVETWKNVKLIQSKFTERPKKLVGRIMFPTTHDITQQNMRYCAVYLRDWLKEDNEILIVSKPDPVCIKFLCEHLYQYRSQITFRFTIGSLSDKTLKYWEPNAPGITARLVALEIAYKAGYQTSVSCEPYLDDTIVDLVTAVLPWVTDTVWIGKMNQMKKRVGEPISLEDRVKQEQVKAIQSGDHVRYLYQAFKDNPKVKWKDSIKEVLGLGQEAIG